MIYAAVVGFSLMTLTAACSDDPKDPSRPSDSKPTQQINASWSIPQYRVTDSRSYTKSGLIDRALGSYGSMAGEDMYARLKEMLGYNLSDMATYHEDVIEYQSVDHMACAVYFYIEVILKSPAGML